VTGVLATNAAAIFVMVTGLWAVSVAVKDTSIIDIFWGFGFVVVAWVTFLVADGSDGYRWLLAVLTSLWGLRLTAHLANRNLGHGEDFRYAKMRERHGSKWPLRSLWSVFWVQGILMWVVSLPVQGGQQLGEGSPGWLAWVGVGVWAVGLFFETVGDLQLGRFIADPANRGKVMDRGLWRYTRHPNYFGDFSVWWGIWLVALAAGAWWTAVGPLVMSLLLIKVSGAGLLEKSLGKSREGYEEYVARTSGFFPLPPRRR
jgi:steroid 5-alpha reductase family enzyme